MTTVLLSSLEDAPAEASGIRVDFEHPLTEIKYEVGLFCVKGKYYGITDPCKHCQGSLAAGELDGMYASCLGEGHAWNVKSGVCKYNRSETLPTYRVAVQDDGLFIEI